MNELNALPTKHWANSRPGMKVTLNGDFELSYEKLGRSIHFPVDVSTSNGAFLTVKILLPESLSWKEDGTPLTFHEYEHMLIDISESLREMQCLSVFAPFAGAPFVTLRKV